MPELTPPSRAICQLLTGAALGALLLAGTTGCGSPSSASGEASAAKGPPLVKTTHPLCRTLQRLIEQPARIVAFEQTPIHVKIPGYVEKVCVEIGQRVKKGELLAQLRVPEVQAELRQKTAAVAQAQIDITLADKSLLVAGANVQTAEALVAEARASRKRAEASVARWKSEANRMADLVRDRVIEVQSRDETLSQYRSAEAARDEVEARVKSAGAAHEESKARLARAEVEVSAARNRQTVAEAERDRVAALLDYARITAPFDGVVSQRNVDTGHFLQPASGSGQRADPLFVVVRLDKVRVFLEVPETDAVLVREGEKDGSVAHIRVPVLNDREFLGRVTGTSRSLEPDQRTLRAEVDLDNPEGVLRPGMYAQALIEVEQPGSWVLPPTALLNRDGQTYCFLAQDGKAVQIPVKVGVRETAGVQVLKRQARRRTPGELPRWDNITGDETVVADSLSELIDGQEIRLPGELASAR